MASSEHMISDNSPETPQDGDKAPVKKKSAFARWAPIGVIVVAMVAAWQTGVIEYLSYTSIVSNYATLSEFVADNLLLAILAYVSAYAVAVALSLPGALFITITGGLLFGTLLGGTATVVGATLGATLIFLAARTSIGGFLKEKAGPFLSKFADGFKEDAWSYLLILRLAPVFPFWLVNLAPAFLGVALPVFVITTFVGIIPGSFAFTAVGAGLGSVIEAQLADYEACVAANGAENCTVAFDPSSLASPTVLGALIALSVVAALPVVIKKFRKRKAGSQA